MSKKKKKLFLLIQIFERNRILIVLIFFFRSLDIDTEFSIHNKLILLITDLVSFFCTKNREYILLFFEKIKVFNTIQSTNVNSVEHLMYCVSSFVSLFSYQMCVFQKFSGFFFGKSLNWSCPSKSLIGTVITYRLVAYTISVTVKRVFCQNCVMYVKEKLGINSNRQKIVWQF